MVRISQTLCAFVAFFMASGTQAAPISYSFDGIGSGCLDANCFTNSSFQVDILADTINVGPPIPFVPDVLVAGDLSGTILISGIGTASFVEPLYVFVNNRNEAIGFGNGDVGDLINFSGPDQSGKGLDSYNLTTQFGPITDTTPSFASFDSIQMDIGNLTFSAMSEVTFTANMAVPVPAAAWLFGSALGLLGWMRRKKA